MKIAKLIVGLLTISMLAACTQQNGAPNSGVFNGGGVNKSDVGTLAGAVGGGVLGHNVGGGRGQVAATIAGTLLGAYVGNSIGKSLDNADLAAYNATSQKALETAQPGQSLPWENKQSGNSGTVTAGKYYQTDGGQYCREYQQTVTVGGKTEKAFGKACRQPDGSWKIVE